MRLIFAVILTVSLGAGLAEASGDARPQEPLAEVDGETITSKDLEQAIGAKLSQLEQQIYRLKRQELEGLIAEKLLIKEAAQRGLSLKALLEKEVMAKTPPVTEQEVEAFVQTNKARLPSDSPQLRARIRAQLQEQKLALRHEQFVASLRARSKVLVHLKPPPVIRLSVSTDGAPARGADKAPITLVEFSDYHCPFCKRAQATVKQLLERYPDKVRHVFRDFPVESLHPEAPRAAEAARCARDQGRFWEYHDLLFANAPKGAPEDLRRYAEQAGLDVAAFEKCVSDGRHRETVQREIDEARRLGLTGTPAFFVNGRLVQGAQPLEAFVRVIEEELAGQ